MKLKNLKQTVKMASYGALLGLMTSCNYGAAPKFPDDVTATPVSSSSYELRSNNHSGDYLLGSVQKKDIDTIQLGLGGRLTYEIEGTLNRKWKRQHKKLVPEYTPKDDWRSRFAQPEKEASFDSRINEIPAWSSIHKLIVYK